MARARIGLIVLVGALALVCAGTAAAQPPPPPWRLAAAGEVQLRDLAAIVRIVPEARRDIAARVTNSGPLASPTLRVSRGRLTVDGGLRRGRNGIGDCDPDSDDFTIMVGRRRIEADNLPHIELRVPEDVVLSSEGAVQLTVTSAKSARVHMVGCSEVDIERVRDSADISVAGGSGDVRLYEAGSAAVRVAGGGDVFLGAIRAGLDVSIAGSGDVAVTRADGPTNIAIQGSGDVLIRAGRASTLTVVIAGSGDVVHQGSAERLEATIIGSGDVSVNRVSDAVSRRIVGSGEVLVAQTR